MIRLQGFRQLVAPIALVGTLIMFAFVTAVGGQTTDHPGTLPAASPATVPPAATDGQATQPSSTTGPSAISDVIPSSIPTDVPANALGDALRLARKGDFDAAINKYQRFLEEKPKSPDAYAGMARVYLKKEDVKLAYETATKGMQVNDAWPLRVVLGEIYFRQGHIPEAEKEWVDVINSGHPAARAYLGLARVRWAISLNKKARDLIDKAHNLDPSDPDIQMAWIGTIPRAERIRYYEKYLAEDNDLNAEERADLERYLASLKEKAKPNDAPCRLVSKVTHTETPLVRLLLDPTHLRGYGLAVKLNGTTSNIMLDTGASGILVKRHIAEKAGITKLTDTKVWGVGDKGRKNAYVGIVQSIRIGDLEFQNCPIEVMESRSVADEDGLIGADVFSNFLVEIDFPNEKLKLSELPKRPGQTDQQLALKNDADEDDSANSKESDASDKASAKADNPVTHVSGPLDRYIAPEMQSFTHIYRFGHELLIPTKIGNTPSKLFLLDSGALNNSISPAAAREVTKVQGDSDMTVKGISGSVKNVYSADKAVLQFGGLRQENQDMLSFDTTSLSEHTGTEISGFLGFVLLRFLDIKIDYRDALVDFTYDAKRFNR